MRFDYFLANLLFGMTLLTAFMSAAHLLGDLAVARTRFTRKASVALRVMILVACSLTALILFLAKLSGTNINQTLFADSGVVEPRLSQRGGIELRGSSPLADAKSLLEANDDEHSWTLYNVFSEETTSELRAQIEILKLAPPLHSLVNSQSPAECVAWRDRAASLGIKIVNATSLPAAKLKPFVLACASDSMSPERLTAIRDLVTEGASVLLVGKVRGENSRIATQLLLTKSFRQLENTESAAVVIGGSIFSFGGLPSGFRIDFGPGWLNQPGTGFAEVEGDGRDLSLARHSESTDTVFSAMILRTFGAGRVAWTSLPATLGLQLDTLYGPYWNLVTARLFAKMASLPIVGIENVPGGTGALVIPAIHAQYKFKNASSLIPIMTDAGASASLYLVMSEALAERSTFKDLLASKHELGASDLDHNTPAGGMFFETARRYSDWRREFRSLSAETVAETNPGAIVPAGLYTGASAYAALLANRFAYALGDPFNDWTTPYSVMMERTAPLRKRVLDRQPVRGVAISDDLTILPMASGDDFQFITGGELMPRAQIISRIMKHFEEACRLGGPLVLPIHTQVLGDNEARDILKDVFASLKNEHASFMNVSNYLSWWKGKSALSFKNEVVSPTEVVVHLTNVGSAKAENLSLRMASADGWQITRRENNNADESASVESVGDGVRLSIKTLEPGKSVDWVLKKQSSAAK